MLVYLRHGETNLNGPAGSSQERLRGWLPANLTPKGVKQANAAADTLSTLQPASFHTSDLPRALETADIVSRKIGQQPTPEFALRDWHTGDLAGHRFTEVKDQLFNYIDNPHVAPPNGEPLNEYVARFVPFVKQLVEDPDVHLVVGHARGTQVIHALANNNGQWISTKPLKEKPVIEPGQHMIITPDWSCIPEHPDANKSDS